MNKLDAVFQAAEISSAVTGKPTGKGLMERQQVLGLPDMSSDQLTENLENVF